MFFFYGLGSSELGTYPLPGVACTYCHTPGALLVAFFSRYFHFFWIPVFPFQKKAVTVCQHCQQALEPREWPASYRPLMEEVRRQVRFPLTNFAGLLLVGALLLAGTLLGWFADEPRPQPAAPATTAAPVVGSARWVRLAAAGTQPDFAATYAAPARG